MSSSQIRLNTDITGSGQEFGDAWIARVSDVIGITGDAWNSGRFGTFDGNLSGNDNASAYTLFQVIDDLNLDSFTDTSITSGALDVAAGNRTVDMGYNDLAFDNVGTFAVESGVVQLTGASCQIIASSGSLAGSLQLREATVNGTNSVELKAPASLASTTVYEFPDTLPVSNDYILACSTGGKLSWAAPDTTTDTSITSGSLLQATGSRVANFGSNSLTFDAMTTFTSNASSTQTFTGTAVVVDNSGAGGGVLRINDGSSNYVDLKSPSAVGSPYEITLPTGTGTVGQVLEVGGVNGNEMQLTWADNATGGGGTVDTNIVKGSMTDAVENRIVPLAGFDLTFSDVGTATISSDTFRVAGADGSGGSVSFAEFAGGADSITVKAPDSSISSYTIDLPSTAGSVGEYLKITGSSAGTLTTSWEETAADNSITVGVLGVASDNRVASFAGYNLDFTGVGQFTVSQTGGSELQLAADAKITSNGLGVAHSTSTSPASLNLYEPSQYGSNYVGLRAAGANMPSTYSIVLPSATATENYQVLRVDSGGATGSLNMDWWTPNYVVDGENIGFGSAIYNGKNGNNLQFKTITSGDGSVTITENVNDLDIRATGLGGGESNTGANVGTGEELFKQKSGVQLQFRNVKAGDTSVSVTTVGDDIEFTSTRRKEGSDSLGSGGSVSVNFDSGDYDNKTYEITSAPTITLNAPSRAGAYSLTLSTTGDFDINWSGTTSSYGQQLPTKIRSGQKFCLKMQYDGSSWHIEPLPVGQISFAVALSGTWTFDCDQVNYECTATGALTGANTLTPPNGVPTGETVNLVFTSAQTHVPSVSGFNVSGSAPTHAGRCVYVMHKSPSGWDLCRRDMT